MSARLPKIRRPFVPEYTAKEIREITAKHTEWERSPMFDEPAQTRALAGRTFFVYVDEKHLYTYHIGSTPQVRWRLNDGPETTAYAKIYQLNAHIYFLLFLDPGDPAPRFHGVILDEQSKMVTLIHTHLGTDLSSREAAPCYRFGALAQNGRPLTEKRQDYTTDLVGRAIRWRYHQGEGFANQVTHYYVRENHYMYDFPGNPDFKGYAMMFSCDYIKIAPEVYLFVWVEYPGGPGIQGVVLMDLAQMHDIGAFYGINRAGRFETYPITAHGEFVPIFDGQDALRD